MFFESKFPIGIVLVMLAFDLILYALLAIYLDKVMPGKYGIKHNLCFCFTKKYWFPQKSPEIQQKSKEIIAEVEEVSEELKDKAVIFVDKISKKFKDSNDFAVKNLSMTIYESQITALLGHNGAGKTTLINMLLGSIPPTSGTAHIYGKNVTNPSEMSELRSMFGVCLQENILFDELDSEEHLSFFGQMKGLNASSLKKELKELLIDVDLYENRFTSSKDLSGGQKRKLCIAIALIASPKIVILDEPTSGVDIAIRQQIWKMIRSYKSDKTIIMTTHYMEEADVMSDRKAIISKGILRCVGSSLFLKQKFGVGYHLVIDLNKEMLDNKQMDQNIKDITQVVLKEIDGSKFEAFIGCELFYILPQNQSQNFSKLFSRLEDRINTEKDIISYGISMTSLEEVFVKLEDEVVAEEELKNISSIGKNLNDSNQIPTNGSQIRPNFCQSFFAYLRIKFLLQLRNPVDFISMLVMAVIFSALIYFGSSLPMKHGDPILLSPEIYEKTHPIFKYKSSESVEQFTEIVKQYVKQTERIYDLDIKNLKHSFMSVDIERFSKEVIDWKWIFNETHIYALPILQNLMANTYLKFTTGIPDRQINAYLYFVDRNTVENTFIEILIEFVIMYYLFHAVLVYCLSISVEAIDDREVTNEQLFCK